MATEYGSRLRQSRKHAQLTQAQLSKKTGVPQSTISTAEREGKGSGETPVYARACGVSAWWMATGDGEMLNLEQDQAISIEFIDADAINNSGLTPDALRLAKWLDSVPDTNLKNRAYAECMGLISKRIDEADRIAEREAGHTDEMFDAKSLSEPVDRKIQAKANIGRRAR